MLISMGYSINILRVYRSNLLNYAEHVHVFMSLKSDFILSNRAELNEMPPFATFHLILH